MRTFVFESQQWLAKQGQEVFDFFSKAQNLEALTPDWLNFKILTPCPIQMRAGSIIAYRLKIRGIPVRWRTGITAWDRPRKFVDEQLRGPYRLWVHEHLFDERDGATLMTGRARYAVPGGALVNRLFVQPEVERIFEFRREKLAELFPGR